MASNDDFKQLPFRDLNLDGKISEIHNQSIIFSFLIFSFLLLFALCFIYTLYLCTHRWHQPVAHADNHSSFHEISGPGLDPVAINSLPIVSYGSASMSKEMDCSICLGNFQYGEKVKLLPQCYHAFHSECLDKWLVTQSNCPLCRAQVHPPHPNQF